MAKIRQFRALIYNKGKVQIDKVVAPPYDVIDEKQRDKLYQLSPYNIIRLILNKSEDPYTQARLTLEEWIREGILIKDERDSIYIYQQEFEYKDRTYKRLGFISLLKLEEPGSRVLPHERTYDGPKRDRFKLLMEVKANLSPIFVIFPDPQNRVLNFLKEFEVKEPILDFIFEGIRHKLWRCEDPNHIEELKSSMADKSLLIADGHHRYEVALAFRNAMRKDLNGEAPYDYILSYFASAEQEGLFTLPTHRVVNLNLDWKQLLSLLSGTFYIRECRDGRELFQILEKGDSCTFGIYIKGKFYYLRLKDELKEKICEPSDPLSKLSVNILHNFIFKEILNYSGQIYYTQDEREAVSLVDSGKYDTCFFLNPTPVEDIKSVAERKSLMPQKSTYFYPKVLSGLLIYKF